MPRRHRQKQTVHIGTDTRIAVNLTLKKFFETPEQTELEFPSSYSAEERAYVHLFARQLGLRSKSRGKGINRYVTVYKREGSTIVQADPVIKLQKSSRQCIYNLLHSFPLNHKECQDLLPPIERECPLSTDMNINTKAMGRLNNSVAQVPQLKTNLNVLNFRKSLPVYSARQEILNAIAANQVVIIAGETGSGKTTQIPQYILEDCEQKQQACRIICTQPRRISAVSIAERVAFERDEKIGQTLGYQIRLESRVAPKTLLTFCTNGVLLRTLMGGDSALTTITHIIVDEVHERDRFCDFLLIPLKDALLKYRSLKLVLMSATLDVNVFSKYFNTRAVINIMGRMHDVETYFLEDVLRLTGYKSKEMLSKEKEFSNKKDQCKVLETWTQYKPQQSGSRNMNERSLLPAPILSQQTEPIPEKVKLEPWLIKEMDQSISDAWLCGGEDNFTQLLHLIISENVSVDYQHSKTSVTPLMAAAGRGCINTVEQFLNLGANLHLRSCNEWTALDWAKNMKQPECAELIEAYMKTYDCMLQDETAVQTKNVVMSEEDKFRLDLYQHTFNDDNIDYDLVLELVLHIHLKMPPGSILVFLPGYDDIVTMREKVNSKEKEMTQGLRYNIYILHSNMQICDQKKVFKPSPQGTRKIIFSTNIAETSITIDDVVYVIDTGKVKEKSFDAISRVCTLKSIWISQACAKQRRGRAGRCKKGICYHLFSRIRHSNMEPHRTPEILRLPLEQLCLYTKQLAPGNTPIAEFLDRALESPSYLVTRNAVQLLKTIDALDPWEDLTELGTHLLDLPVEPRLGKMLLYAVVLKCLDPILTIVCSLLYKDPFIFPTQPSQKRAVNLARKKFAMGTYSDHMALLRAFQGWQNARASGKERAFCEQNFISAAVMEMIVGTRTQLLGQLRASGFVRSRAPGDIRDLNSNSDNWAVVKAALTAGLYPNLIRVDREHMQLRTQYDMFLYDCRKQVKVVLYPSSTLRDIPKSPRATYSQTHAANVEALPCDWLLYEEMSLTGQFCHVRTVTLVNPLTIALFGGPVRLPIDILFEAESVLESESDSEVDENHEGTIFKLDDWVVFKLDPETARFFLHLRQKWNALFLRRMKAPNKAMSQLDEKVVSTVVNVITNEEQAYGLQQPSGIGQRPRPIIVDYYPANTRRSDDLTTPLSH